MPKNLIKRFIIIADRRTQVAGYIYGTTPPENDMVKEIKCIVMVPQVGNLMSVTLPNQAPDSDYLANLEPLGWIHTQLHEKMRLNPYDVTL